MTPVCAQVRELKALAKAEGADFVSTNDVVTSWFLKAAAADAPGPFMGLMPVNFRGKVEGCEARDAGNYEDMITYLPPDVQTPWLIRRSLAGLRRVGGAELGPFWRRLRTRGSIVTNWTTFAEVAAIPGCRQDLHLPLYDVARFPPG